MSSCYSLELIYSVFELQQTVICYQISCFSTVRCFRTDKEFIGFSSFSHVSGSSNGDSFFDEFQTLTTFVVTRGWTPPICWCTDFYPWRHCEVHIVFCFVFFLQSNRQLHWVPVSFAGDSDAPLRIHLNNFDYHFSNIQLAPSLGQNFYLFRILVYDQTLAKLKTFPSTFDAN